MSGREHCTKWYTTSLAAGFQGRSIDALLRICDRLTFTAGLSTGIVSYNRGGLVRCRMRFGRGRWSMPTYEYMCKKCGPFTQLRPMAECELPSACPECGTRAPRVLLTAPGCLTMSAEARQAGAKYERSTDGLHDPPPYLRDPAGWTKKLKRARKLKRAQARASRPA